MSPEYKEKVQEKANWAVHTILYEQDQQAVDEAWEDLNYLPCDFVLSEVEYYDPASAKIFIAWFEARDLLQYIKNISDPGPKE